MAARPFLVASLASLALAFLLGMAANLVPAADAAALATAHLGLAIFGAVVPALTAAHLHAAQALHGRRADDARANVAATAWVAGAALLATATLLLDGPPRRAGLALALVALAAAATLTTVLVLRALPGRGTSVVDVARDPLTKGDDASLKHTRIAHFLLTPAVIAATAAGPWWAWDAAWAPRVWLAGIHLLLAGHAMLSTYALTHLWVPRLSGVPAIAAGAIKGELHSSLLGLLLLTTGFAAGLRGLVIAGGAFLFFAAFTWMGVLGANIMRNKSRTQRVTPEFTYVPWAFTGVFWVVCGILLGVFLNAVPDAFASRLPALRFTHAHAITLGGFAQLAVGLALRIVPRQRGQPPVPFHRSKWAFYGLNLGLAGLLAAHLQGDPSSPLATTGSLLAALGLAGAFMCLRPGHSGR